MTFGNRGTEELGDWGTGNSEPGLAASDLPFPDDQRLRRPLGPPPSGLMTPALIYDICR